MMKEEKCLHKLYEYLPYDIDIESLVVLGLDVAVDIHAQHFSHDTLNLSSSTIWPRNSKSPLISTIFLFVEACSLAIFRILISSLNCWYNSSLTFRILRAYFLLYLWSRTSSTLVEQDLPFRRLPSLVSLKFQSDMRYDRR